jgi:hypothetical protein
MNNVTTIINIHNLADYYHWRSKETWPQSIQDTYLNRLPLLAFVSTFLFTLFLKRWISSHCLQAHKQQETF